MTKRKRSPALLECMYDYAKDEDYASSKEKMNKLLDYMSFRELQAFAGVYYCTGCDRRKKQSIYDCVHAQGGKRLLEHLFDTKLRSERGLVIGAICKKQTKKNDCWARCIEAVNNYYALRNTRRKFIRAEDLTLNKRDEKVDPFSIMENLDLVIGSTVFFYNEDFLESFKRQEPVIMYVGACHYILVNGIRKVKEHDLYMIHVSDPDASEPVAEWVTLTQVKRKYGSFNGVIFTEDTMKTKQQTPLM